MDWLTVHRQNHQKGVLSVGDDRPAMIFHAPAISQERSCPRLRIDDVAYRGPAAGILGLLAQVIEVNERARRAVHLLRLRESAPSLDVDIARTKCASNIARTNTPQEFAGSGKVGR